MSNTPFYILHWLLLFRICVILRMGIINGCRALLVIYFFLDIFPKLSIFIIFQWIRNFQDYKNCKDNLKLKVKVNVWVRTNKTEKDELSTQFLNLSLLKNIHFTNSWRFAKSMTSKIEGFGTVFVLISQFSRKVQYYSKKNLLFWINHN